MRVYILTILIVIFAQYAHADDRRPPRCTGHSCNDSGGDVSVDVGGTEVDINAPVDVGVGVDVPVNVNTQITQNRNVARQTPNAYFNYTPNFLQCGRVLGFQYGNPSGIGSIGIPLPRDKSCDIWLAVNEAQENGHVLLSYAFMCEIRNIKKVWGKDRCNEITDTAGQWWVAMAEGDMETVEETLLRFEPPDSVVIAQEEHDDLEEELRVTQMQLGYVQNELEVEREQNQRAQQEVQQKIQQYEKREARKQESLDAFLQELESREENE
jgi:hypothetical protein